MPQFKMKPVVVHAVRFVSKDSLDDILSLVPSPLCMYNYPAGTLSLFTPGGVLTAHPGDWVVGGVDGVLYPCTPDRFEMICEEAA